MLKKGTVITCPECHDKICKLSFDPKYGMIITDALFEPLNQIHKNGDLMNCKKCNSTFFKNQYFHTENGWVHW